MDFSFSDEQKHFRDAIIRFARKELNEGAADRDRDQQFPRDLWRKCGDMRLPGLAVPEEYGGLGLDPLSTAISLDAFGYACHDGGLVFSICAHLLSCVVPIWKFGSEEQKKRYLPGLCDGTLVGGNATTEPGSGSDAFAMSTRAEPDGDGWRINGTKMFVSNGPVADVMIVYAMTDPEKKYHGGVTGFLVEKDAPGFAATQKLEKMGLRSSPLGELVFENVRVGPDDVLGEVGIGGTIFVDSMDWERTCLFAAHAGTIERLLETSIQYARTRKQFDQTIGKFQAVAHSIADMKVALEAGRLLCYKAASRLEKTKMVSLDAAIAKLFVSEAYIKAALDTVQVHGGNGFTTEYEVERSVRDAVGCTIYSGTSEMQRNIIASWLGL